MPNKYFKKYRKVIQGLYISIMILSLSACAHMAQPNQASTNPDDASAQTYGLTADRLQHATTLESLSDASVGQSPLPQKIINAMVAPADQTYYFDYNASGMDTKDYPALKIQADYLITHPTARVRLEGNTDSRGSREYNITLGWRRDKSVDAQLLQYGVAPAQIVMVSYGKEKPAVDGIGAQVWALNRRVNLVYEAK